jgi:hypothetical protein
VERTRRRPDENLAGDAVGAAEGHDLLGDVGQRVVRPSTACSRARAATDGLRQPPAMRVPSMSPGATQLTVIAGASATARQRVRWMSAALLEAYAIELPSG